MKDVSIFGFNSKFIFMIIFQKLSIWPFTLTHMRSFILWSFQIDQTLIIEDIHCLNLLLPRVIKSNNKDYNVGEAYMVQGGWSTHTLCDPKETPRGIYPVMTYRPGLTSSPHPESYFLGVLGMPG